MKFKKGGAVRTWAKRTLAGKRGKREETAHGGKK